jgi:2-iminobutanoate/2-iminopropanoate deaminase
MSAEPIPTPHAKALGPYSPAVRAGDWIVGAGQIGVDPDTGALVPGGLGAEARQALRNVEAVLADCGGDWGDVAKVTLFVAGAPEGMPEVNAAYQEAIGEHRPARSTVGVAWLPLGASFEIEVWIHRPQGSP